MTRKATGAEPARLSGTQSIERALILMREIAAHNRTGTRLLDLASVTESGTKAKLRRTGMDLAELAR